MQLPCTTLVRCVTPDHTRVTHNCCACNRPRAFLPFPYVDALLRFSHFFIALQSLRETYNTAKCEEVLERINGRLGPEYDVDRSACC